MSAMLCVVARAVLVAMTVHSVQAQQFSERAFLDLELIDLEKEITATLINADHKLHLRIMDEQKDDEAIFELDPDVGALIYNDSLGIQLNYEDVVFFDILSFSIEVTESDEERKVSSEQASISIVLALNPFDKDPFIMEIPVFTTPTSLSQTEKTNPLHWQKWAADHRVGVFAPIVQDALKTALETGKIALDFKWLEELLSHNIYPSNMPYFLEDEEIITFATRPLVVSEQTKNVLIEIVNKFKPKVAVVA